MQKSANTMIEKRGENRKHFHNFILYRNSNNDFLTFIIQRFFY